MMRRPLALVLSASALVLSACSSYADTDAKQVAKDVKSAMGDLKSLHIDGNVTSSGTKLDLDLSLDTQGDCDGTMSISGLGSFELISTAGKTYVRPDKAFWNSQNAGDLAKKVGDKWVASTGAGAFGSLTSICDLDALLKEIDSNDQKYSSVSSSDEVDGQDVVKVSFTGKDKAKGELYVLSDEPHYIVKASRGSSGTISFSDFNKSVDPKAPAKDEIFDASKLH